MTTPAVIVATINSLIPINENTRDFIDSGKVISGAMIAQTFESSIENGLNLVFHCATRDSLQDFRSLEVDLGRLEQEASKPELSSYLTAVLAKEHFSDVFKGSVLFNEVKGSSGVAGDAAPSGLLFAEVNKIHVAKQSTAAPTKPEENLVAIHESMAAMGAPYFAALSLVRHLVSKQTLDALQDGQPLQIEPWMETIGRLGIRHYESTTEGQAIDKAITDYAIQNMHLFEQKTDLLYSIGFSLKYMPPGRSQEILKDVTARIDSFTSNDYQKSGLVFYVSALRDIVRCEDKDRSEAVSIADAFYDKFLTTPHFKQSIEPLFSGPMNGSFFNIADSIGVGAKADVSGRVAYDVLSRINKLSPNFGVSTDPSMLLSIQTDPKAIAKPMAYFLSLDPKNEKRVRDTAADTWQVAVIDSVTSVKGEQKRMMTPEVDSGPSM